MKKRDLLILSILVCLVFILISFISRHALSYEKFIEKCKKNDLNIIDVSSQFQENDSVHKALIAESKDYWQIEFYEFDSKKAADERYKKNLNDYQILKSKSKFADKKDRFTYSEYSVTTFQRFIHVCKIGKTLLYVNVPLEYQNDVESIIRLLHY